MDVNTEQDRRRGLRIGTCVLLVVNLLAACSAGGASPTVIADSELAFILAEAQEAGASSEQIAVIELALAEGRQVTFEEYKEAMNRNFDCLRDLGVDVRDVEEIDHFGWIEITYFYGGLDEGTMTSLEPAMDACMNDHVKWIDIVYQSSLDFSEMDAILQRFRPLMIECVNQEGAGLPADATLNEAIDADYPLTETDPLREMCGVKTGLAEVQ
ncbi:MAG: hypothetical protein MUP36_02900 [Demequinaceae bacterium]|nr:hypothetical protein [Demequinaceae bacterium]